MSGSRRLAEEIYEAPLPRAEFDRRLGLARAELNGPEGEALAEYMAWFIRRYPDPLERIAYARRKYREAEAVRGIAFRKASE